MKVGKVWKISGQKLLMESNGFLVKVDGYGGW